MPGNTTFQMFIGLLIAVFGESGTSLSLLYDGHAGDACDPMRIVREGERHMRVRGRLNLRHIITGLRTGAAERVLHKLRSSFQKDPGKDV